MKGTVFIRRHATRSALLWSGLLIVLAVGQLACDGTVVTPTPVQPTPASEWTSLGYYTLTMTAAPSCSLPDYAMKAVYRGALLTQSGEYLVVQFDPYGPFEGGVFGGTVDGQSVRFTLDETQGPYDYYFVALVDSSEVAYFGTAAGAKDDSGIVAAFSGTVRVSRQSDHATIATCVASDHRLEMVRQ
jgi:hypothetical protein